MPSVFRALWYTDPVPDFSSPVINDAADRALGRIILRYGIPVVVLALLAPFGMAFVNVPQSRFFPYHKPLDLLSILVVLTPFFIGVNRVFAARLALGREYVAARRGREAVAPLDPGGRGGARGRGQRFLDASGEAHALLAQAYAGLGEGPRAEAMRAFVLKHRPGVWADRLKSAPARPTPGAARVGRETGAGQEKRPRPANGKPRRRF